MTSFWLHCLGDQLEQGDYLPACSVPAVGADFAPAVAQPEIASSSASGCRRRCRRSSKSAHCQGPARDVIARDL
jgi:hypothetical protein